MTELDCALWKRITYIVQTEHRPFSYIDFVPAFNVDGQTYEISRQGIRNKICEMLKAEKIDVVCYSPQGFYTIKGIKFSRPILPDHIGVFLPPSFTYIKNDPIYRSVKILPFGQKGIHNLRLRLEVRGIWSVLSSNTDYIPNPRSKDIKLEPIVKNGLDIKTTVHKTDTVSVVIECSYCPIEVDATAGIDRLSAALQAVRDLLSKIVKEHNLLVPYHRDWIVTMWHFGADALTVFAREKYYRRWEIAEKILLTIYVKEWQDGKRRIRWDCQEYPNKPSKQAVEEKLKVIRELNRIGY